MRHFNTVLFTVTLVFAISFGWSLHPDVSWWEAIQHMTHGSTFGWLFVTGLSLPILLGSRRWPIRAWLRFVLAAVSPLWLAITLLLRSEWFILIMIAVSTAILVLATTPWSRRKDKSARSWKFKSLFIETNHGVDPDATTTWK